ncbi:MAG: hypothetical protein V4692_00925 [Bdellovibrionota bacterium]
MKRLVALTLVLALIVVILLDSGSGPGFQKVKLNAKPIEAAQLGEPGAAHRDAARDKLESGIPNESAAQAPDINSLMAKYERQPTEVLERHLVLSKKMIEEKRLIDRANSGNLSTSEKTQLVTEIRRQAVLNNRLVETRVNALKKKYL